MIAENDFALLSSNVYQRGPSNKTPLPSGWSEEPGLYDENAAYGFTANTYIDATGQLVIAFAGMDQLIEDSRFGSIPAALGWPSEQVGAAAAYVARVIGVTGNTGITFTGHSLGGGLASLMAVFFDKPATIFNPAPFEAAAMFPRSVKFAYEKYQDARETYGGTGLDDYRFSPGHGRDEIIDADGQGRVFFSGTQLTGGGSRPRDSGKALDRALARAA